MKINRTLRLNSLLKEVISDVITKEVKNPLVSELSSVAKVEITEDLRHAKVFISVIGTDKDKEQTLKALESASGFIAIKASKKITIRYFPALTFKIDDTVEKQIRIENLVTKINDEQSNRKSEINDEQNSSQSET